MVLSAANLLVHCGDHGGVVVAREIVVAVKEVDWRVLLVQVAVEVGEVRLITCGWSWVVHSDRRRTPVSGGTGVDSATPCHGCGGR